MIDPVQSLERLLDHATSPEFRGRLLDKGLARGLIWQDGVLPQGAPPFPRDLTEDLLDYAHGVLAMSLQLRSRSPQSRVLRRSFLVAGEAIEAAVHRGGGTRVDRGFNRVSAAVSFQLAQHAARAYSLLPTEDNENLSPGEACLVHLMRRSLDGMHERVRDWLLDAMHGDQMVAQRLLEDPEFGEDDMVNVVLTTSFMRGVAWLDHALMTGETTSADEARRRLSGVALAAAELGAVTHWWTCSLAKCLAEEIWEDSLHARIPRLSTEGDDGERWNALRQGYIRRLRAMSRSVVELWPSQLEAARRAVDPEDDLVVALPTSAGKTRVAELCILRALASSLRVIYVTPLRALSAQVERDLLEVFAPLGFSVSTLYGAAGISSGDTRTLREGSIVVSTPEKLDFALRVEPSVIDDVGLVVLDEGHMLGPSERGVRYEALVMRLLLRPDAGNRRIVCLSALFPSEDEMGDLVAWIRQDSPGSPVYSIWRPTRQRFGVLWWVPLSGAARLDVRVESESPFVPRFVEARPAPVDSRRRRPFPAKKNELTLAAAWQFVQQGKDVMIYCPLRKSIEVLGKLVLECVRQGVLGSLSEPSSSIAEAMATGAEWLGADHPAVRCLQYGVALHHAGLPRPFLKEVESLLRTRECRVTIASPTLAQGVNLSASVLIVSSIWRNKEVIPASELANVAGRAGRAFVDLEGLVLHVVWEEDPERRNWAVRQWESLVVQAKAPAIVSGLHQLVALLCNGLAERAGIDIGDVIEYVTGNSDAWDVLALAGAEPDVVEWQRDLASLDAAILTLLDPQTDATAIALELDTVLAGSLFSRIIAREQEPVQTLLRGFVTARARHIWAQSTVGQRKGYHASGMGLRAGQFLSANMDELVGLLLDIEAAIAEEAVDRATTGILDFARVVFRIVPFRWVGGLPRDWGDALRGWVQGLPAAEVVTLGGHDGVDLLQDAFVYRLPWAMEAVRAYAVAVGHEWAEALQGLAPMAVEAGSLSRAVITLLRAGLNSRDAGQAAVTSTRATFADWGGMLEWLGSAEVTRLTTQDTWPTPEGRHSWLEFIGSREAGRLRKWECDIQELPVSWLGTAPAPGTPVVLEVDAGRNSGLVLTPSFELLATFHTPLRRGRNQVVASRVGDTPDTVRVEYFGPP